MNNIQIDHTKLSGKILMANQTGKPLYLLFLATKPCYIKLASLVFALRKHSLPFIIVDTGQHYEQRLINALFEFDYLNEVVIWFNIKGSISEKLSKLAIRLGKLWEVLDKGGLQTPAIPIVSGDTFVAGATPYLWYVISGYRSVHVEAGLRSQSPFHFSGINTFSIRSDFFNLQQRVPWIYVPDEPYPESINTSIASKASFLLFAPCDVNRSNLVKENYTGDVIKVVGSLSTDAVALAEKVIAKDSENYVNNYDQPILRIDIHRRENLGKKRLSSILGGIRILAESGINIVLLKMNLLNAAIMKNSLLRELDHSLETGRVKYEEVWISYCQVIAFLKSDKCLGIITDSGGLQEECNILGVPCLTCRFSTDRPETVIFGGTNWLVPPVDAEFFASMTQLWLNKYVDFRSQATASNLYGTNVGEKIALILRDIRRVSRVCDSKLSNIII